MMKKNRKLLPSIIHISLRDLQAKSNRKIQIFFLASISYIYIYICIYVWCIIIIIIIFVLIETYLTRKKNMQVFLKGAHIYVYVCVLVCI
jgi:hypothetical protein